MSTSPVRCATTPTTTTSAPAKRPAVGPVGERPASACGARSASPEMALLFGAAAHPHTGEILSTPYRHYRTIEERIESKLAELGDDATPEDRLRIRAEQYRIGDRAPVAGYDCTFSPAKSVSALWALAPADQRAVIEEAHDRAVDAAFGWLEERALAHPRRSRRRPSSRRRRLRRGPVPAPHEPQRRPAAAHPLRRRQPGLVADRGSVAGPRRPRRLPRSGPAPTRCTWRQSSTSSPTGSASPSNVAATSARSPRSRRRSSSGGRRGGPRSLAGYDERSRRLGRAATPKERSDVLRTVTLQTRAPKVRDGHLGLHERWIRRGRRRSASTGRRCPHRPP